MENYAASGATPATPTPPAAKRLAIRTRPDVPDRRASVFDLG